MRYLVRTGGGRGGFVLLTSAVAMIGLLALAGLAVDAGRLYIARGELQVFADEAALAATFELDGTPAGLTRARNTALSGPGAGASPNRWNFASQAVSGATTEFAASSAGPFDSNPSSAAGLRFLRVVVSGTVNLYFLPLVPGIGGAQHISVTAVAGQNSQLSLGDGLAPFSPTAHDSGAPNFGFTAGQLYTLRWAPPGQRDKPGYSCAGDHDAGFSGPGDPDERGYVDVGQGTGAAALRAAVVNNSFFLPAPLTVGSTLAMYSGQESVPSAVSERFSQDSDVSAPTFSSYNGNGRRLLTAAVNGGGDPATVLGFALFFLQPIPCGTKNTTPCCAEYVGPAVVNSSRRGGGSTGLYAVQLVQ
jgi:Flp pilus assembly protein TadG